MSLTHTFKQITLTVLNCLAIAFIGLSLVSSWGSPQPETRLDLLQTDLLLQVSEWKPSSDRLVIKDVLVGKDARSIYLQAAKDYEQAIKSNQKADQPESKITPKKSFKKNTEKQLINDLSTRLGLLQANLNQTQAAIATWEQAIPANPEPTSPASTAEVLKGLWSEPSLIFPDAESQIRSSLDGWFRNAALAKLYKVQQRETGKAQDNLLSQQQFEAEGAIERLVITSSITIFGGGLGIFLVLILGLQRLFFPQSSPLRSPTGEKLSVPWPLEKIWEVMVLWFTSYVVVSQILLPIAFGLLNISPDATWSYRDRAVLVLVPYVLSMAPMLYIFRSSLQEFLPLPPNLFHFNFCSWRWLGWGIGGYLVAVPLVLIISILSQQLLQDQGGGNPLLPMLVESQDNVAKLILWSTLAIAAPFFEELLFRGFLLPSLLSFLPTWGAIALSGLGFAVVHLNLSDILPLTALGMVLGFVYLRSGNLLAPMLLHSLWNSGTFFTLLALSSKLQ